MNNKNIFNSMESNIWYKTKYTDLMGYRKYTPPNKYQDMERVFSSVLYRPEENIEISNPGYVYIKMYHYLNIRKYFGLSLTEFLNLTFREYYRLIDISIYFNSTEKAVLGTAEKDMREEVNKLGDFDGIDLHGFR